MQEKSQSPKFWNDPQVMQQINQDIGLLQKTLTEFEDVKCQTEDLQVLLEMSYEEKDETTFSEVQKGILNLQQIVDKLESQRLLSGAMDSHSAFVCINSGAGGTESCDWAEILFRMYSRFSESEGFTLDVMEMTQGEEAGVKSVTFSVEGVFCLRSSEIRNRGAPISSY